MVQPWQLSVYIYLPFVAAGISLLVAVYSWRRQDIPGSNSLAGLMLSIAVWSLFEGIEKSTFGIPEKIFWSQLQYLGISSTPVFFLIFSARYSQLDRWLTGPKIMLLWLVPVATIFITATNNYHMWHWSGFQLDVETNLLIFEYGPWFWVHTSFAYIYLLTAIIILLRSIQQIHIKFRQQIWIIIFALLLPWCANIIHLTGLFPIYGIDPTPVAFTITGLLITLSIAKFQLMDLTPIARDKLVDTLQDVLIVVDFRGYVVDLNPAALKIMDTSLNRVIKKPASKVLGHWPYLANRFMGGYNGKTEQKIIPDIDDRWYDTRISLLKNSQEELTGFLVILRDISDQRKTEEERARLAAVIEQTNEAIIITDLDGKIIYGNPYFEQITGYAIEEVLGKDSKIIQSGDHDTKHYEELWATISRGDTWTGTFINKRKDGSKFHEAATIFPIMKSGGKITNYAAVKRDISAEAQAEKAIKYFSDQLTSLHEISIILSLTETFDDLCRQVIFLGRQKLGFDRMGLWFVDPKDSDFLLGSFGIDAKGQLKDERNQRIHTSTTPNYVQFLQEKNRVLHVQNAPIRNENTEVIGSGDLVIAGMWDKGKIIGYISVDNFISKAPIDNQQQTILVLFSQTLANLVIRKRADEALYTFSDQLAKLHDITIELSQNETLDSMCKKAIQLGSQRLGFDRLSIWFLDSTDVNYLNGSFGIDDKGNFQDERNQRVQIDSDPLHSILLSGSPRVYHEQNVTLYNEKFDEIGLGDIAGSALWDGSKIIGYLRVDNLLSQQPFASHQLDLLILFAQSIGNLSTRIKATEETLRKAHQQTLLNNITKTAIELTDFQEILQALADRLGELFKADGCYLTIWDEERQLVIPGAAFGPHKGNYRSDPKLSPQTGERTITRAVLESGEVLIIDDIKNSPFISKRLASEFPSSSILGLPLIANDQKLGAALISYNEHHNFPPHEIALGEQAAQQIALAILKTRLLEKAETRAREAETLRQASAAVVATLKRDEAIERILEELNRVVPYDSASVQLLLGKELEIVGERGFSNPNAVIGLRFPINLDTPNSSVFKQAEPVIIADAQAKYEAFLKPPHDHIRGWMGVPLKVKDRIIGMLALDSIQPNRFTNVHGRLATAFADQVAIALENTRLFEETQWLAIHDSLTGLYNRRHYMSLAWGEFQRATRYGKPLSVIMLDIDHFKRVNDTYGHLIGDQVLQLIANICDKQLRVHDVIGRYGGEEFVILLPETAAVSLISSNDEDEPYEIEPAKVVAERLRSVVESTIINTARGDISVTISLGIAELNSDIKKIDQLIDCADQALLNAKKMGRNRVVIWNQNP
jgi:diguanylate cyclase (GGDEF)-like protein/PAS domain S-box-containing protein